MSVLGGQTHGPSRGPKGARSRTENGKTSPGAGTTGVYAPTWGAVGGFECGHPEQEPGVPCGGVDGGARPGLPTAAWDHPPGFRCLLRMDRQVWQGGGGAVGAALDGLVSQPGVSVRRASTLFLSRGADGSEATPHPAPSLRVGRVAYRLVPASRWWGEGASWSFGDVAPRTG